MLESKDDAKVSVNVEGEIKVFKEDQVDMADLTFLGDACFHRGGKTGGSWEETSQTVSKFGRKFWSKPHA